MRQTKQKADGRQENRRNFSCGKCPFVEKSSNCVDRRLWKAIKSSDVKAIQVALADGARLGARDDDGKTAMELARESDDEDVYRRVSRAVLIESTEQTRHTVSGEVVRFELSDLEAPDTVKCPEGRLLVAAKAGDLEGVKSALADGANPDARDAEGNDAMALGTREVVSHLKILKLQRRA